MSQEAFARLSDRTLAALGLCQDAGVGLLGWSDALQGLAEGLGASSCVIRTCSTPNPFRLRHDEVYGADSIEHLEFSELWFERVPHVGDPRPPNRPRSKVDVHVQLEDEIVSAETRASHPFYHEVAGPGHRE